MYIYVHIKNPQTHSLEWLGYCRDQFMLSMHKYPGEFGHLHTEAHIDREEGGQKRCHSII